ncbi:MAG: hypothetical protein AB7E52_07490 [Bdellovibrionales bacterium]
MSRIALIVVGLSLLVQAPSAQAASSKGINYSPEQRFSSMRADESDTTRNVQIAEVNLRQAPPYIVHQAKVMADKCTNSLNNAELVHIYAYMSDFNRKNKLSPNYIIDYSPWSKTKVKPCFTLPPCDKGMCSLVGYSSTAAGRWVQAFKRPVVTWGPKQVKDRQNQTSTYLELLSSDPTCKSKGAQTSRQGESPLCKETLAWGANGLTDVAYQ